jgi:hypothetical protein
MTIKTIKGVCSELIAAKEFLNKGYYVAKSLDPQCPFDLIVVNKKGNVVGIAVAQLTDVQGFNFGIKSSTVSSFVNSNKIYFSSPNMTEMSSRELSKLMNEATVFVECSMRVKDIKAALEKKDSKKVFYSDFNN